MLAGCELISVSPTERTPHKKDYGRPLPPGEVALEKVTDPSQYPDFGLGFGDRDTLIAAIDGTLEYFAKPSSTQWFPYLDVSHERSIKSLERFREILLEAEGPEALNAAIVAEFDVYRSKGWDGSGTVLFTGYCQPIYDASETKTAVFGYPLYGLPSQLVKDEVGKPLGWDEGNGLGASPTRQQFDQGALEGQGLELYWLKSALEVYIVHVQGSAKLTLPNGEERAVGYAGKTEHPYTGLGQMLVEDGKIDRGALSLSAIKDYFARNPQEIEGYLQRNASYVFFTEIEGGPYGSMNIAVTPYRTIATDKAVYPRGGIAFADTRVPTGPGDVAPFHQFVLDQDTGGAIRSAGRCDVFLGTGPEAERIAGGTNAEGKLWYIYLKE
jgi:membrane-bound lytic murein transglycosylase A